jgi:hypothetical protein
MASVGIWVIDGRADSGGFHTLESAEEEQLVG